MALCRLQKSITHNVQQVTHDVIKEYMSDSVTNYNYVGNTKVSVLI